MLPDRRQHPNRRRDNSAAVYLQHTARIDCFHRLLTLKGARDRSRLGPTSVIKIERRDENFVGILFRPGPAKWPLINNPLSAIAREIRCRRKNIPQDGLERFPKKSYEARRQRGEKKAL